MELNLNEKLKEHFGFASFKGRQEEAIRALLAGEDCFVLMPTGGGKSLCYQLPALLMEGTAIVVSPLIALMKNQVDAINAMSESDGLAHCLNSSMSRTTITSVKEEVRSGKVKLLYMAPESLCRDEMTQFLREVKVSFYAIDEAHCISEWGHDFRPEYRRIRSAVNKVGRAPIIALTATATEKVRRDIKETLGIKGAKDYTCSFNRPNLYYEVRTKSAFTDKEIIRFIRQHQGQSGIIYCLSRKSVEELANILRINDIKAAPYHAGMDAATRSKTQDDFLAERTDIIVATIAFGMGIDKPDVRFVIHYDIPKSLEGYYQETGRAGRDGGEGTCIAYFARQDLQKLEKFADSKPPKEQEISRMLLQETAVYAESCICRRKTLLNYFGERYPEENCGKCDNCLNPAPKIEATEELRCILRSVEALKGQYHAGLVTDFVRGRRTDEMETSGNVNLESFGCGKDRNEKLWPLVVRQGIVDGYIAKEVESFGNLKLTAAGKKWLKHPTPFSVTGDRSPDDNARPETPQTATADTLDKKLFALLKALRRSEARRHGVQPYIVFMEVSLEQMATVYPTTLQELHNIQGVGQGKAKRYGQPFCDLIRKYCDENNITPSGDTRVRTVPKNNMRKLKIVQCVDKEMPLGDIAQSQGLKLDELLDELESIVYSGTKLDLDYCVNDLMEEDAAADIYDYFSETETDSLDDAYKAFNGEYPDEHIRLVRLKYISEKAN